MMYKSEAIFTLESIFNLGRALGSANTAEEILKVSILSLMGKLKVSKVAGFVLSGDKFKLVYSRGVEIDDEIEINRFKIPSELTHLKKSGIKNFIPSKEFDYILPIRWAQTNILALIFLGGRDKGFTRSEIDYINFVSNFTAVSLKNINSILELKRSVFDLTVLNEFTQSVLLKRDEGEIFNSLALTLMGHFGVESVSVIKSDGSTIKIFSFPEGQQFSSGFVKKILKQGSGSIQFLKIKRFSFVLVQRSPDDQRSYVLLLGRKKGTINFKVGEVNLLQALFTSFVNAVENLKMISLNYDINLAYNIQRNLLPLELPRDSRVDIHGLTIPSKVVSGDYYDVLKINRDEFIVVIADICGKGLSASLLMSNLQASLRSILLFTDEVEAITNLLNKVILLNTSAEQFITFFICKINLKNLTIEYINAGHNPPVLLSENKVKLLEKGGAVLGVFKSKYKSEKIKIDRGDLIFLYTDGVTEAMDRFETELGIDKVIETIRSLKNLSSREIVEGVVKLIK
ncbi:MAG: PP2C family protein-serine/threonine phosphatase, partial [Candidatus Kryptonium sp.]